MDKLIKLARELVNESMVVDFVTDLKQLMPRENVEFNVVKELLLNTDDLKVLVVLHLMAQYSLGKAMKAIRIVFGENVEYDYIMFASQPIRILFCKDND
ncbi:MAG: hypothetical protein PHG49_03605 [Candidatus Pacebacteria bacterium]|nr:hypothetical protein [Candidatus Paceibacterota bacterium]